MQNEAHNESQIFLKVIIRIVSLSLCMLVVWYITRIPREIDQVRNGLVSILDSLYFFVSNVLMLVAAALMNKKPKVAGFTLIAAAVCILLLKSLPIDLMLIYLLFLAVGFVIAEVHSKIRSIMISRLLYALANLSLLGGIVLCVGFWPGDPGGGYSWKIVAYYGSIISLTAGIVGFAFVAAVSKALDYLAVIEANTSRENS